MPFVKLGQSPLSNVNFSCNQFNVSVLGSQGGGGGGGERLLWISSNRDDEMGAKSKPQKIRGPKINPPKNSMPNFRTLK